MSHIDVVPVDPATRDEWEHPPFGGDIADGFIWGRGTLDIKCGAVGILEAVEFLLAEGFQPSRDIYLAFGHDEEVGGANGNARMAATLKERGVRIEYVIDEGGILAEDIIPGIAAPVAYVAVAEKGYSGLTLTAQGTGGHSSMPPPQTAVGIVAAAIQKLESNPFPSQLGGATGLMLDYLGPEMLIAQRIVIANRWLFGPLIKRQFARSPSLNALIRTTTAATMMEGSVARNVLPTSARVVVNFRILPGDTSAQVLEYVRATVNDPRVEYDASGKTREPPTVSDTESVAFKTLQRTIGEVFPGAVVAPALTAVTTDSPKYEEITENTFRFIPTRMNNEGLTLLHGVNERIAVQNYLEIIRFFIQQIRNSAR
ncbi:M20/M25/M40 family metallo-hydrolase [Acidobacteria bacterium AH-259-L09]|nr:M20/M25/M40 family metallo-hydrolase [Acidobacteria bacterium AH-259-L09]